MVATGGHANSSMPLDDDGEPSRFGEALSPAAAGHSADQLAHESFLAQGQLALLILPQVSRQEVWFIFARKRSL
eukprot:1214230-Amphidinium_carterae.1